MTAKTWTSPEVLALLAWVDFCLLSKISFETTIVNQLSQLTLKQITNKLIGLGRKDKELRVGQHPPGLKEIISKGSVCIPGLGKNLRVEIAEAVEQLRILHPPSRLTSLFAPLLGEQNQPKERPSTQSGCHDGHVRQILELEETRRASPNVVS
jgi:hypothetical protein